MTIINLNSLPPDKIDGPMVSQLGSYINKGTCWEDKEESKSILVQVSLDKLNKT